jgi:putative protease
MGVGVRSEARWLGQLLAVERGGWLQIRSRERIRAGQGVVLEVLSPDPLTPPREIGGRVMACEQIGRERLKLRLGPHRLETDALRAGASVWLTSDPAWQAQWQRASRRIVEPVSTPLVMSVAGAVNQPLNDRITATEHRSAQREKRDASSSREPKATGSSASD